MQNIGIDIGGTTIIGGVVDADGKIILKKSTPTLPKRENGLIIADIIALCKSLISDESISAKDIRSISIGSPGIINPQRGMVINATNLGFINVPLGDMLKAELGYPIHIDNDANCAALGESIFGAAKGSGNSVTVTLGTGIGGGIVTNGSIYAGSFFGAGEVGHHIICMDGEPCCCGMKGCWEAYASASALIRDTEKAAKSNPHSKINHIINADMNKITAKTAFDAAAAGDETAKAVVEQYIDYLCIGLINIINILQPDTIVIGGGVSGEGSELISMIENRMDKFTPLGDIKTKIALAKLGNDAGIIGAAQMYRSK
jgi:glucokinase